MVGYRYAVVLAACLVALGAGVERAAAQSSSEVAAARALFRQGLAAARAGQWEQARERFERSYEIAPRPNTLLNLAGAQVQTGALVQGAESYRRFLSEAREGRARRYRRRAQSALEEVEGRIAHLVIEVAGRAERDVVVVDGEEVSSAVLGVDLPVNPGSRTVVLRRGDQERARETVQLEEGERRELTLEPGLDLQLASEEPSENDVPREALAAGDAGDGGGDDSALWIGVGIGAGVVAVAAVVLTAVLVSEGQGGYSGNLGAGSVEFE